MKEVRPTSGRVLLALFNILGSMEDRSFLDLFAGTGRVGIEALKRGASSAVMVETLKSRATGIERALPGEFAPHATVLSLELRRGLAWLIRRECLFDVAFADPPYGEGWGATLLKVKDLARILKPDGVLVVEHASREKLSIPPDWREVDTRLYGETTLTFLRRNAGADNSSGKLSESSSEEVFP